MKLKLKKCKLQNENLVDVSLTPRYVLEWEKLLHGNKNLIQGSFMSFQMADHAFIMKKCLVALLRSKSKRSQALPNLQSGDRIVYYN